MLIIIGELGTVPKNQVRIMEKLTAENDWNTRESAVAQSLAITTR